MEPIIEKIPRQNPVLLHVVYGIRQTVFEKEQGFPKKDRMVFNEWDALATHYLLINQKTPIGTISVVDWTGLTEILKSQQLPTDLRIAKLTKLAILPPHRSVKNLKRLVLSLIPDLAKFEYITADIAPPSSHPDDTSRYDLENSYSHLFNLERISIVNDGYVSKHILGRRL